MDRFDQLSPLALIGDHRVAARVDYQTCDRCGFRLMRVETTMINDQRLTVKHCPICDQFFDEHQGDFDAQMTPGDSLRYFEGWLATHGLDRGALEQHYHLAIENFFDPLD